MSDVKTQQLINFARSFSKTTTYFNNVNQIIFDVKHLLNSQSISIHLQDSNSNQTPEGGASEEQLQIIYDTLREDLPHIFVSTIDYSKVHKDIVFENRIRGKTYRGIVNYVKQLSFLRLYGHLKYAYVKCDVIKMTMHTEDSTVKVRWRISGITGYKILFKMIEFRVWDPKRMIEEHKRPYVFFLKVTPSKHCYNHLINDLQMDRWIFNFLCE